MVSSAIAVFVGFFDVTTQNSKRKLLEEQMQKLIPFLLAAFVLAPGSYCYSLASPSASPPKTVVDYFLLLPQGYLEAHNLVERKALLKPGANVRPTIVDIKHDYILVPSGDAEPTVNVVVFRHAGRALVAVLDGGYDPAVPTLNFLRYERGHWRNVSKAVLPGSAWEDLPRGNSHKPDWYQDNHITFRLPRFGTTIEVFDSGGAKKYDLIWHQGKFIKKPPLE